MDLKTLARKLLKTYPIEVQKYLPTAVELSEGSRIILIQSTLNSLIVTDDLYEMAHKVMVRMKEEYKKPVFHQKVSTVTADTYIKSYEDRGIGSFDELN